MDILFRLETVVETTIGGHPEATIMYEYAEAAKEIRKLREQRDELVNYAFVLRTTLAIENAAQNLCTDRKGPYPDTSITVGLFDETLAIELPVAMQEAARFFTEKNRSEHAK